MPRTSAPRIPSAQLAAILFILLLPACTSIESGASIQAHRYRTLFLAPQKCFRDPSMHAAPQDTAVYVYTVHVNHIRYFGVDEREAAEALVNQTNSAPSECTDGIRLASIGRIEGGLRAIAVICRSPGDSAAVATLQGSIRQCTR